MKVVRDSRVILFVLSCIVAYVYYSIWFNWTCWTPCKCHIEKKRKEIFQVWAVHSLNYQYLIHLTYPFKHWKGYLIALISFDRHVPNLHLVIARSMQFSLSFSWTRNCCVRWYQRALSFPYDQLINFVFNGILITWLSAGLIQAWWNGRTHLALIHGTISTRNSFMFDVLNLTSNFVRSAQLKLVREKEKG